MRLIEVENIKSLTTALFAKDSFDKFLVTEASISALNTFTFDGHINDSYLDEKEAALPDYKEGIVYWSKIKPLCYEIIKGKKVPLRFKIVFALPKHLFSAFLKKAQLDMNPDNINALFLNIGFQANHLTCTTAISLKSFSLDKSLENAWDEYINKFIISLQEE